jgi:hypothetical protein
MSRVIEVSVEGFARLVADRLYFHTAEKMAKTMANVIEWADRFLHLYAFPGEPLHPAEVEEAIQDCLDAVVVIRRMSRRELAGFSGGTTT